MPHHWWKKKCSGNQKNAGNSIGPTVFSVFQSCLAIPLWRAGCQVSDRVPEEGTRSCRSHAAELCEPSTAPHQLTWKHKRHPFPSYFIFFSSVLSLFRRCLKDFTKSGIQALGPDGAEAACRRLLDSWMKISLIKHQPSPGNKSFAPALQECLSHRLTPEAVSLQSPSPGLTPSLPLG